MTESPTKIANRLLAIDEEGLEELRVHEFEDEESAHDDALIHRLLGEFAVEFGHAQAELKRVFGEPLLVGTEDNEAIPLNGVFRFAVWEVEGRQLYLAASHEDRGVPVLLMLGTV